MGSEYIEGYTRWAVNMDLTKRTISSITHRNRIPQETVDLKAVDFSPGTPHEPIPIYSLEDEKLLMEEYQKFILTQQDSQDRKRHDIKDLEFVKSF